jgi:hypothetical protein
MGASKATMRTKPVPPRHPHSYSVRLWHTHTEPHPAASGQGRATAMEFLDVFAAGIPSFEDDSVVRWLNNLATTS